MSQGLVWIIGAKGMLGSELSGVLAKAGISWVGSDREVDIRDPQALEAFGNSQSAPITWVVNCSAYTAVDKAEDEIELARSINATGVGVVAQWCATAGARLVHISTDYVFNGRGIVNAQGLPRPWVEDDPVEPLGVYGRTKAEGESLALSGNPKTFVLRTAWLYGAGGPNFVSTMIRLMGEKPSLGVVGDQIGSPTWARDLCGVILSLIKTDSSHFGIYHCSGEGQCSWYEFALAIQAKAVNLGVLGGAIPVRCLATSEYPTKAQRPTWSVSSKEKLFRVLGVKMPAWEESLEHYMNEVYGGTHN